MLGRLLLWSASVLWLVQTAHTGGYVAGPGRYNGQGPQANGRKPPNGGNLGRMLMPSKGVGQVMGAQNRYAGYPTKGVGNGPAAGVSSTNGGKSNGYGAAAGVPTEVGMKGYGAAAGGKPQGYGVQSGPTNGQQMKGNGYGAQAGAYGGQGTKGNGYGATAGGNGARPNGGAAAHNGFATKGRGHGATSGVPNGNGAKSNGQKATVGQSGGNGPRPNGQGGAGSKPMKGYGRPPYGAGPGVGMGPSRGLGVPQLARNQGTGYGSNGYNGYKALPIGGYNGGYGNAGFGLGSWFGNGGMKGPKQGYGAAAGVPNGQSAKPNGYAGARAPNGNGVVPNGYGYPNGGATRPAKPVYSGFPNGYGAKPNGYGGTRGGDMRPQPGYGTGAAPNGYGAKPNGYGAAAGAPKGYGGKPNGHGVRNGAAIGGYGGQMNGYRGPSTGSNPQTTKGVGAVSPGEGYGVTPNGKGTKGAGLSNGKSLKGGEVLVPEQPSSAPEEVVAPQQAITQGAAPAAPEPTSGILVMVTQERHQKMPSPEPQGKSYQPAAIIPEATPEPLPASHPQGKGPKPGPEPTPEPAPLVPQGKSLKAVTSGPAPEVPQSNPAPEPPVVLPQGYVTGSAVPEQKGAEADVLLGEGGSHERDAAPESSKPLKTKAVPETVAAKSTGSVGPEQTLTVGVPEIVPEEANLRPQPGAGPDRLGVKGLPAGESGATGNGEGPSISKGQGAKPAKPDCGPSGIPNGQWMKIPRPVYNAGAGASAGTQTKGYGAGTGVPNRFRPKSNGYGAGGYTPPGHNNGYGAGFGYPYAGNPKQPAYGQGAYLGAGYGNGNSYGGNGGLGQAGKPKSAYGNGYVAGVQPDYASLGQGLPTVDGKSGGGRQIPYNGAPVVSAGLDGMSQFEPQSAGLGPNGKLGSMYGGMGDLPFGGQTLGVGAEKSNAKYGIGGLQFGGKALGAGNNGAGMYGYGASPYGPAGDGKSGKYGGLGAGSMGGDPAPAIYGNGAFPTGGQLLGLGNNGNAASKYGYGRMPYEAQPAALSPEAKSTGMDGSQYQPEPVGLGHNGEMTGKYGGADVPYVPQALGFGSEAKSVGKYDNMGSYQPQPPEPASEDTPGLPYEPLPLEPDTAGKSYVKGEVPTPAIPAEAEEIPIDRYENVGYINGQVQPEVVAFPAAPTPSPDLAFPSAKPYLPGGSSFTPDVVHGAGTEDLPDPAATAGLPLDYAPAAEIQPAAQTPERPAEVLQQQQQQQPRQIHIQQHFKLHFHPQGAKKDKYDLNSFFGNSGYQG